MNKLQYIKTYSADTISKFTDLQIQTIIDHFTEKPNMEFTDEAKDEEQDDDQNNVLEVLSLAKLISTAPIPLVYDSNSSSDNSKEVSLSNSLEAEDDYYKMLLEDYAKNCVYFDSTPQLVKETNESDDDNYDEYGEYNEYGECDRGYYYRDREYERKTS